METTILLCFINKFEEILKEAHFLFVFFFKALRNLPVHRMQNNQHFYDPHLNFWTLQVQFVLKQFAFNLATEQRQ